MFKRSIEVVVRRCIRRIKKGVAAFITYSFPLPLHLFESLKVCRAACYHAVRRAFIQSGIISVRLMSLFA